MNEGRMTVGTRPDLNRPAIPGIRCSGPVFDAADKRRQPPVERCLPLPNGDPPATMLWGDEKG